MDNRKQAYWNGFMKAAEAFYKTAANPMQQPRPLLQPLPAVKTPVAPSVPTPNVPLQSQAPKIKTAGSPQAQQIQQMMSQLPIQQQQQLEKELARKFGISGQSFSMNPSAHL